MGGPPQRWHTLCLPCKHRHASEHASSNTSNITHTSPSHVTPRQQLQERLLSVLFCRSSSFHWRNMQRVGQRGGGVRVGGCAGRRGRRQKAGFEPVKRGRRTQEFNSGFGCNGRGRGRGRGGYMSRCRRIERREATCLPWMAVFLRPGQRSATVSA